MNRCEVIRALIPNAEAAKKPAELIALLPQYKPQQVRDSITLMYHHAEPALLDRVGNKSDGFAYFVCREVQVKECPSEEARRAALVERERLRSRKRRGGGSLEELRARQAAKREAEGRTRIYHHRPPQRTMAEYRALQAAERERKAAQKAEDGRLRAIKRAAEKAAAQQAAAARRIAKDKRARAKRAKAATLSLAKPARTQAQRLLASEPHAPATRLETPKAEPQRAQSIEDWLANGGQIEVLPSIAKPRIQFDDESEHLAA